MPTHSCVPCFYFEAFLTLVRTLLALATELTNSPILADPYYLAQDGEKIFEEGDLAREMFILRRGRVQVLAKDGHVLVTLDQGQFFGEIGLFAVRKCACECV